MSVFILRHIVESKAKGEIKGEWKMLVLPEWLLSPDY
jgi:hypothetical protein